MKTIQNARGFTLIELLVVVAIIGILAAIAIPQFSLYRQRAFDSSCQADAHSASVAEEAYYVAAQTYLSSPCDLLPGFKGSAGVTCDTFALGGNVFFIFTAHPQMSYAVGCWYGNFQSPNLQCG